MFESRAAEPVCGRLQSTAWRESSSQGSREPPCFTPFPPTETLAGLTTLSPPGSTVHMLLKKCLPAPLKQPECASTEPYRGQSTATAMP